MDKLLDALRLTAVGMGVVFVALIALSQLMGVLPFLAGRRKDKGSKPVPEVEVAQTADLPAEEVVATPTEPTEAGLPAALLAVIATAVAAYLGQTPENLNVISIRRASATMDQWTMAARRESIQ